jgi:hypothetical protein
LLGVFVWQYRQSETGADNPLTEPPEEWDSVSMPRRPDPSRVNDPQYWRERAEALKAAAAGLRDIRAINTMLRAAETYERLAELTESRLREGKSD